MEKEPWQTCYKGITGCLGRDWVCLSPPRGKGWRVDLRIEVIADSKPFLTPVNPPGLTVFSGSPKHIKEIKTMGSFLHSCFDCPLVCPAWSPRGLAPSASLWSSW